MADIVSSGPCAKYSPTVTWYERAFTSQKNQFNYPHRKIYLTHLQQQITGRLDIKSGIHYVVYDATKSYQRWSMVTYVR